MREAVQALVRAQVLNIRRGDEDIRRRPSVPSSFWPAWVGAPPGGLLAGTDWRAQQSWNRPHNGDGRIKDRRREPGHAGARPRPWGGMRGRAPALRYRVPRAPSRPARATRRWPRCSAGLSRQTLRARAWRDALEDDATARTNRPSTLTSCRARGPRPRPSRGGCTRSRGKEPKPGSGGSSATMADLPTRLARREAGAAEEPESRRPIPGQKTIPGRRRVSSTRPMRAALTRAGAVTSRPRRRWRGRPGQAALRSAAPMRDPPRDAAAGRRLARVPPRSSLVDRVSPTPVASAEATSAPTTWCATRKAIPAGRARRRRRSR